jgi:acyl-CoA thioesterase FadM
MKTVELDATEARVVVALVNLATGKPLAWASWIQRHLQSLKAKCEAVQ